MGVVINISAMVKPLDNPPNRIREVRKARRMTLKHIADALNTTQTQISRFETGERPTTLDWLQRIARVLGTDAGDLLNAADNRYAARAPSERTVIDIMRSGGEPVAVTVAELATTVRDRMTSWGAPPTTPPPERKAG